jgi:hypothetical protein
VPYPIAGSPAAGMTRSPSLGSEAPRTLGVADGYSCHRICEGVLDGCQTEHEVTDKIPYSWRWPEPLTTVRPATHRFSFLRVDGNLVLVFARFRNVRLVACISNGLQERICARGSCNLARENTAEQHVMAVNGAS